MLGTFLSARSMYWLVVIIVGDIRTIFHPCKKKHTHDWLLACLTVHDYDVGDRRSFWCGLYWVVVVYAVCDICDKPATL